MNYTTLQSLSRVSTPVLLLSLLMMACNEPVTEDHELLVRLPETIDFNYHIRPILSDRCYKCHGPDENTREASYRLDTEEGAFAKLKESSRSRAIVPGSLRRSELAHRIVSDEPEYAMPPPEANLALSEYEVAIIRKWIDQGADWKDHWAFIPPEQPALPEVDQGDWTRNEIDYFILSRLESEDIAPSPEADKERLLRRVYLDLTGLPPDVPDIDAFLADDDPEAYEEVVDKLLASPAYAERMAIDWMDISRYADSHGYHADGYRMMWPWRDWVINAFDNNMRYDEFIRLQLAGDLLPNATAEQKLATAFHRNHQMTAEGGIVDEEYRLEYVADRTNTTARAFMGLTMECARCHDHKFDPITQKEYFQLSAFFNNVNEVGMTGDDGNSGPMLLMFEEGGEARLDALKDSVLALEGVIEQRKKKLQEELMPSTEALEINLQHGLASHLKLDKIEEKTSPNSVRGGEGAALSGDIDLVEGVDGRAVELDYDFDYLEIAGAGLFDRYEPFSISLWANPEEKEKYAELFGNADHKNSYWRGYEVFLDSLNQLNARLIHALPHNQIHVRTKAGLPVKAWSHVTFTYDGSSKARGIALYIDGVKQEHEVIIDKLYKSMLPVNGRYETIERPLRFGKSYRAFSGEDGIFTGRLDDIRIYSRALSEYEVFRLAGEQDLQEATLRQLVTEHRVAIQTEIKTLEAALKDARKQAHDFLEPVEEVMVMEEMERPRKTHVLNRGAYDQPGEEVRPGTPAIVRAFEEDAAQNRLGLAQWLVAEDNPLTARVAVNRFWQMHFGKGIVETPADMGYQGALPSHPALLDWLATTFVDSGWDVKAIHRLIVTSATYRQSSRPRTDLVEVDPLNTLLARATSQRLSAEMIRDNALAASGLLVRTIGGPSVRPYQPEGLWIEKGTYSPILLNYIPDKGDGLYRRSLYTFVKRTSPPPSMMAFDATDRSECTVQRQSTSTPLQSLILMNDPQYIEAGRVLAERMQLVGGTDVQDQMTYGFRALTGRRPTDRELGVFSALLGSELERFQTNPSEAEKLLAVGDRERDTSLDLAKTAALAVVANTMINHDEAYTKR